MLNASCIRDDMANKLIKKQERLFLSRVKPTVVHNEDSNTTNQFHIRPDPFLKKQN